MSIHQRRFHGCLKGEPTFMENPELSFGNYRALELLARGGYGQVYRGEHRYLTRRVVAIKIMHNMPLQTQQEREAFIHEANLLEALKHPSILPVIDVGLQGNVPYLVTEYAPGGSLRQHLQQLSGQLLSLGETLTILRQIGGALHFAHEQQVIHRDLKPDNILFRASGEAMLADFGIAILLHTASFHQTKVIGTPVYMAPEQFRGQVCKETDQYALACLAYELLTGQVPFTAPDFIALGFKHVEEPPLPLTKVNPLVPPFISEAVLKALSKDRGQRYPTVQAFVEALSTSSGNTSTSALYKHESVPPAVLYSGFMPSVSRFSSGEARTFPSFSPTDRYEEHVQSFGTMFGFNAAHTHYNPYELLLTPTSISRLKLAWSFQMGGAIEQLPVVAGGVVYLGSHDHSLYALDARSGHKLWHFETGDKIESSPAVIGGVVYAGSYDRSFYALDARSGHKLWSFEMEPLIKSSPTVADGMIYIGSRDHSLYALDALSGRKLWSFETGDYIHSTPAVSNGVVYVSSWDTLLYALDARTGYKLWSFETGPLIKSSPAVAHNVVYTGFWDHSLYALDALSGSKLWSFKAGDYIHSSPAIAYGAIYIGSLDHSLYALDARTGRKLWSFKTGNKLETSPTVANAVVYIGSQDHSLYALDVYTGRKLWSFKTGDRVVSSPVVANGMIYVCSHDGNLYAFR